MDKYLLPSAAPLAAVKFAKDPDPVFFCKVIAQLLIIALAAPLIVAIIKILLEALEGVIETWIPVSAVAFDATL